MSLAQILSAFKVNVAQCESLIANAHKLDSAGTSLLPETDRQQITVAAYLNMFIAWETFIENSITELMIGTPTINGAHPIKYVSPPDLTAAHKLIIGMNKQFDYGNHDNLRKQVLIYFRGGYPFEPHISAIFSELADLRIMRHAAAHISFTTQTAMDALAIRLFSKPVQNVTLYRLLTSIDPKSTAGETIFNSYKTKLIVTAELIAQG